MATRWAIARLSKQKIDRVAAAVAEVILPMPSLFYSLFYIFAFYIVAPIVEVPLLGLSISAPLFFLIAAGAVFKPSRKWFKEYRGWIIIAVLIWVGIFFSTTLNGLISKISQIDRSSVTGIIQYAYWLIVFVVSGYIASDQSVLGKLANIFAWAIFLVAGMRWFEALAFGRVGAWSFTKIMTQNSYGFQFSTFTPFIIIKIFDSKGWKKFGWVLALGTTLSAVAINGSRGSWVSIFIGLFIFAIIFFISNPAKFGGLMIIIIFVIAFISITWIALPGAPDAINARFQTFQSLEEDKSYALRQILVRKATDLFRGSPFIGIGANQFTKVRSEIDVPDLLAASSKEHLGSLTSHNSYMQFLAEFGLVGAIPYVVLMISILIGSYRCSLKGVQKQNLVPLSLFISLIQMSAHMWVIAALTGTQIWFMYALNVAAIKVISSYDVENTEIMNLQRLKSR